MKNTIHLGFEIKTGNPIAIPIAHMAVAGQTQNAGKTTALEALISRSNLRAVTFITKRGEQSFRRGRRIPPYFRERADWVFVSSLIDATMREKNRMIRSWLMKVTRGTKTLAEVRTNVKVALKSARGFSESIYTEIDGYLDLVVPQLKQLPPAKKVEIGAGLNVIDVSAYSSELQGLVIQSMLDHIYEKETNVLTVIPEAWEFLPEGRGSPVKQAAETIIRKGASLKNFVWIDSQDIAGVWKLALRAASVWLIGVQREANEIKRTLSNIPASINKPKAADIATLTLGQFFACWQGHVHKVYVQPAWMSENDACDIAVCGVNMGNQKEKKAYDDELDAIATGTVDRSVKLPWHEPAPVPPIEAMESPDPEQEPEPEAQEEPEPLSPVPLPEEPEMGKEIEALNDKLDRLISVMTPAPPGQHTFHTLPLDVPPSNNPSPNTDSAAGGGEELYQAFKARLVKEAPGIIKLLVSKPEINLEVTLKTATVDASTVKGRVVKMLAGGFYDDKGASSSATRSDLKRTGADVNNATLANALKELVSDGFLTREGNAFVAVPGMKVNIVRK